MVASSVFAAIYAASYLVWIQKHRKVSTDFVVGSEDVGSFFGNSMARSRDGLFGAPDRLRFVNLPGALAVRKGFRPSCFAPDVSQHA